MKKKYRENRIWITIANYNEIVNILKMNNITNYERPPILWADPLVTYDEEIDRVNWGRYLKENFDKPGFEILEVGSRRVTGFCFRDVFQNANYTGFDLYEGENVDVVGDAHKLSSYFDKKFDLIFSSAVFEHLAMPWVVSLEIIKLLKCGGSVFIETHYCFGSHERPWHFFQYSENALNVLFPECFGMKCIKKGVSNLLSAEFSSVSSEYLIGKKVGGLYCHSEFLGKKIEDVLDEKLDWKNVQLEDVVGNTMYPPNSKFF